jgi:hypothetical protein
MSCSTDVQPPACGKIALRPDPIGQRQHVRGLGGKMALPRSGRPDFRCRQAALLAATNQGLREMDIFIAADNGADAHKYAFFCILFLEPVPTAVLNVSGKFMALSAGFILEIDARTVGGGHRGPSVIRRSQRRWRPEVEKTQPVRRQSATPRSDGTRSPANRRGTSALPPQLVAFVSCSGSSRIR